MNNTSEGSRMRETFLLEEEEEEEEEEEKVEGSEAHEPRGGRGSSVAEGDTR